MFTRCGDKLAVGAVCLAMLWLSACSRRTEEEPPEKKPSPKVGAMAMGVLDSDGAVEDIAGWAWDPVQPNTPIEVDIYADGKLHGTMLADHDRHDLISEGKGNGKHGFDYPFPESMRDGKPHRISVRIGGTDRELVRSPRSLTFKPPPAENEQVPAAKAEPSDKKDKTKATEGKKSEVQKGAGK
jgi:hypothetical protein